MFPDCDKKSIGFGGTFTSKIINCPVRLIFGTDNQKHSVPYDNGFRIVVIPNNIKPEERKKLIRCTPSVLGMDVLEKFKLYIDKKRVELTI
jgi:hypothetical protein